MDGDGHPLVLYDGHCALCNAWVRLLLALDTRGTLRFAALQSGFARTRLERHGMDPDQLETLVVILPANPEGSPSDASLSGPDLEAVHTRSDAVFAALSALGSPWTHLRHYRHIPRSIRDRVYDMVARNRYAWFGRHETCPLPRVEHRDRFLG